MWFWWIWNLESSNWDNSVYMKDCLRLKGFQYHVNILQEAFMCRLIRLKLFWMGLGWVSQNSSIKSSLKVYKAIASATWPTPKTYYARESTCLKEENITHNVCVSCHWNRGVWFQKYLPPSMLTLEHRTAWWQLLQNCSYFLKVFRISSQVVIHQFIRLHQVCLQSKWGTPCCYLQYSFWNSKTIPGRSWNFGYLNMPNIYQKSLPYTYEQVM